MEIGFKLSSEERSAGDLVADARRAEELGFDLVAASDHFHPWLDSQGESPNVWPVLGAVAVETERIRFGTMVTCPILRIHPAIVAQAAATVATLAPDRFFLGVGTGERLNEHVTGDDWPEADVRRDMLEESIQVIRRLWVGEELSFEGRYIEVDRTRVYSLPATPPPIYVAASGEEAAAMAARAGDGLISTVPDAELVRRYRVEGGDGPVLGELSVCVAATLEEAKWIVHDRWPLPGLEGDAMTELPTPDAFERAAATVDMEAITAVVPMGPDTEPIVEQADRFRDAGFTHLVVHQLGGDPEPFFERAAPRLLEHHGTRSGLRA